MIPLTQFEAITTKNHNLYEKILENNLDSFCNLSKASSQLMISDELRLKLELEKNESEESSKNKRIDFLESKLRNVEILLLELQSRSNT